MTSHTGYRRRDAFLGATIALLIALLVALLIWCHRDAVGRTDLGACSGHRSLQSGGYWQQAAPGDQYSPNANCLYLAGWVIADSSLLDRIGGIESQAALGLDVPVPGRDGGARTDPALVPQVGPYPELRRFGVRFTKDPFDVAIALAKRGIFATPDFLMFGSPVWKYGPAGATRPPATSSSFPTNVASSNPQRSIVVVDTGLERNSWPAPFSTKNVSSPTIGDETSGNIAGHGTFIASRLSANAPGAQVQVVAVRSSATALPPTGGGTILATDDWSFAQAVLTVKNLDEIQPNGSKAKISNAVLNLSFGSYGCDQGTVNSGVTVVNGKFQIAGTVCSVAGVRSALLTLYQQKTISYVTAAAGNDATDKPFFPAAFTLDTCFQAPLPATNSFKCTTNVAGASSANIWLMSVGSPGRIPGDVTDYSNRGPWVNVQAVGTDVIGLVPGSPPQQVKTVSWSGTSFAAPCVAAYLAANRLSEVTDRVTLKRSDPVDCGAPQAV